MALGRVKNIEQLRYHPPGEWGKLLGLDRIPESRTVRNKVKHLSEKGKVEQWAEFSAINYDAEYNHCCCKTC